MDLDYVDRRSFLFDVAVLGRAARSLVRPAGAGPLPRDNGSGPASPAPHVAADRLPPSLVRHRRPVIVLAHVAMLALAYFLAWILHYNFHIPAGKTEVMLIAALE